MRAGENTALLYRQFRRDRRVIGRDGRERRDGLIDETSSKAGPRLRRRFARYVTAGAEEARGRGEIPATLMNRDSPAAH